MPMDLDDAQADLTVAAAVAGCTIIVTLLVEYVLNAEASTVLLLSPLFVYFVYVFGHSHLPGNLDQPRLWVGLAVLVGMAVIFVAV